MEIEIQSKKENPLLQRTEVHFTVHHQGEKTPKRDLIRSELAEQLNVKKDAVIVNHMKSSFGSTDTTGYAKIYKNGDSAKEWEKKYLIKRNPISGGGKKKEKTEETAEAPTSEEAPKEKPAAEKPKEAA